MPAINLDLRRISIANRMAVLRLIQRTGGVSRAVAAARTGLGKATLTKIAEDLLAQGMLCEEPMRVRTMGRPSTKLTLNSDWGHVLTVSLCHTVSVGVVDFSGQIIHSEYLCGDPIAGVRRRKRLDQLISEAVKRLLERERARRILGIGVLSAGVVRRDGMILSNGNLPRRNVDMKEMLRLLCDLPVTVDEEFRLLLRARTWNQEGPGVRNAVAMSGNVFGVGGGHAVLADGRVLYGRDGYAGQPGWLAPVMHNGEPRERWRSEVLAMGGVSSYLDLIARRDPRAMAFYQMTVENYGYRVAHLVNFYNPEKVLIFAPYMTMADDFVAQVRRVAAQHTARYCWKEVEICMGGAYCDSERLTAAAVPLLEQVYVRGEVPLSGAGAGADGNLGQAV